MEIHTTVNRAGEPDIGWDQVIGEYPDPGKVEGLEAADILIDIKAMALVYIF